MTDVIQTIALACFFLPAVILLWLRVRFMTIEIDALQRQIWTSMLAEDIRQNYRHNFHHLEAGRERDFTN